jgi:hypothetical protein
MDFALYLMNCFKIFWLKLWEVSITPPYFKTHFLNRSSAWFSNLKNKISLINELLKAIPVHCFNHWISAIFLVSPQWRIMTVAFVEGEWTEVCGSGRTLGRWLNIGTLRYHWKLYIKTYYSDTSSNILTVKHKEKKMLCKAGADICMTGLKLPKDRWWLVIRTAHLKRNL